MEPHFSFLHLHLFISQYVRIAIFNSTYFRRVDRAEGDDVLLTDPRHPALPVDVQSNATCLVWHVWADQRRLQTTWVSATTLRASAIVAWDVNPLTRHGISAAACGRVVSEQPTTPMHAIGIGSHRLACSNVHSNPRTTAPAFQRVLK
jgi:hypothetical protein